MASDDFDEAMIKTIMEELSISRKAAEAEFDRIKRTVSEEFAATGKVLVVENGGVVDVVTEGLAALRERKNRQ